MAWHDWNPPRWLVWYGAAMAMAWGLPIRVPAYAIAERNQHGRRHDAASGPVGTHTS